MVTLPVLVVAVFVATCVCCTFFEHYNSDEKCVFPVGF